MSSKAKSGGKSSVAFRSEFLRPRFWLTWLLIFLFYLFSLLPLSLINWVAKKLGAIMAIKNKKRFHIASVNLRLCFPEKTQKEIDQIVRQHFHAYMRSLLHYGLLWWSSDKYLRKLVLFEDRKLIDRYREQGKNIIILTCHNAGLEFTGIALSTNYSCSGPYKPMRNEVIDWLVEKGRSRLGTKAYTRDEGFRPLIRDTRSGRLLIYLADEDLGHDMSHFVPFFGVQKATLSVLGRLTRSCDAVVIPCVTCYDEQQHRYITKLMPAIEGFPSDDEVTDTMKMSVVIEDMVKQCLMQYFWTLRLFQSRPAGESSVYE